MNAMAIILIRKMMFFVLPDRAEDRSLTSEIDSIMDAIEIPRRVSAFRLMDLSLASKTSSNSLEIETTSSFEASLRNRSYFLPNCSAFFLVDTGVVYSL